VSGLGLAGAYGDAGADGAAWVPNVADVFDARRALRLGFRALRAAMLDVRALDPGEVSGSRVTSVGTSPSRPTPAIGTRNRPPTNEAPTRHQPRLAKPSRVASAGPGRQTTPADSQDDLGPFQGGSVATATATPTAEPETETGGGFPSRPDPTDPAREVWKLVELAQSGDTEAFGLIYDRYVGTVFRFIYFRVGNRQLAEDLTSDTFLRALKRIGSVTWQGRDLGAWLVTIARNLVADHFKSGRYRLEVTTGDVLDADREDRGPEGSPESVVVDHITNVTLLTAVKQLNPEQQECIVLRFLQGFSVAETAHAMNKNEGAIKALQYRAVRALNRLLPEGFQR
jgi:RNA polymerase sigma-70 factor, ECF subfamily